MKPFPARMRRPRLVDGCGVTFLGLLVYGGTILAALIVGISVAAIAGERHFGRVACKTFARQTGRPTKFVVYTALDGGDCLTRSSGGKWIPVKQLREFGDSGGTK